VACHPELASKEHGWARLKAKVKPKVTGAYNDLRTLVLEAIKTITQKARLEDNRRCREVQKAYRSLAESGGEATSDSLKLWTKKHKKHRGIHLSEIADLQKTAGMLIDVQSERTLTKIRTQQENNVVIEQMVVAQKKRQKSVKRKLAAAKAKSDPTKLLKLRKGNKERKDKFKVVNPKSVRERKKVSSSGLHRSCQLTAPALPTTPA
jgi:hypothetical protein